VVKKGKVLKKGKMLKKVNNKRKKEILRVSRHIEVMLSLVLLMREKTPEVMRQYQRELEADERALEEDSSDDDDDDDDDNHVPLHWRNYDFSRCTVNTGENVSWEYTKNEACVGAMFPSIAHLKDAVKQWSTLTLHREVRVVKSSPRIMMCFASRMVVLFECMHIWGSGTITCR
jgi:hypothetical protein